MILGFFIALLSAVSFATIKLFTKKLKDAGSPNVATFVQEILVIPVFVVILTFGFVFSLGTKWSWITPLPIFWLLLPFWVLVELVNAYFGNKSVQTSDISTTVPLLLYSNVFVLVFAFLMFGELPTFIGFLGVGLIVLGTIVLSIKPGQRLFPSFKEFFGDPGHRYAFLSSFMASLAIVLTKKSFQYVDGHILVSAFWISLGMTLTLVVGFFIKKPHERKFPEQDDGSLNLSRNILFNASWLGFFSMLGTIVHYLGLFLLPTVYFTAIKRTGVFLSTLYGKYVFKEKNIAIRLLAAVPMVVGVILIGLDVAF